jgi:hypothetical protein
MIEIAILSAFASFIPTIGASIPALSSREDLPSAFLPSFTVQSPNSLVACIHFARILGVDCGVTFRLGALPCRPESIIVQSSFLPSHSRTQNRSQNRSQNGKEIKSAYEKIKQKERFLEDGSPKIQN